MKKFMSAFFILITLFVNAQEENKFGIRFSGFVKSDIFYDSREVETIREGHFLLYPLNVKYDKDSADVNAHPSFNMLSIQSRLTGNITAPDVLGAKTSGMLEAEFFGTSNADINGFRLRHALVKLNWKSTELLIGQTWHPMFNSFCFPEVVSFNTGAPFQPFSRNPQIRLTQSFGNFRMLLAGMAQRDFTSPGPDGPGSKYIRNTAMPDMHLQVYYRKVNEEKKCEWMFGAGFDYKFLKPRLMTDSSYKTDQKLGTYAAIAFVKNKNRYLTWKLTGTYGQNLYDLMMLGGYAVKYDTTASNLARDEKLYTSLDVLSGWIEIYSDIKNFQVGIFGGFTKNMGSMKNIADWNNSASYFTRGRDISYIYRISPRVVYNAGKLRFGLEGEYTTAAYGSKINSLGEVSDLKTVSNIRVLLGVFYFF